MQRSPASTSRPENCVTVQLRDALDCANTGALYQKLNRQQRFVFGHDHGSEQPRMIFGVRLAALRAAEALETVGGVCRISCIGCCRFGNS
jgi:hypothetical protein